MIWYADTAPMGILKLVSLVDRTEDIHEHSQESSTEVCRRRADDAAHNADRHERDDMDAAVVCLARCPGHDQRDEERGYPDRGCDEQSDDIFVLECLHNGRKKVLKSLGEERGMLQEDEEVDAPVGEYGIQGFFDRRCPGIVCLASVVDQSPLCIRLFIIFQPACRRGIVGEGEPNVRQATNAENVRNEQRQSNRNASLDDEQPPPACNAMRHVQIPQYSSPNQASKGIGQGATGIEPGNPITQLLARIPARPTISKLSNKGTYISITAPGKNGASTNPRKNRATTSPAKECVAA